MAWRRAFLIWEEVSWVEEMVEKKPGVFERLQMNKKKRVLFFVVSMVMLVAFYLPTIFLIQQHRENVILHEMHLSTDTQVLSNVEITNSEKGLLEFSGWALRLNSKTTNICMILEDTSEKTKAVILPTQVKENSISEYYVQGWNSGKNGFAASIKEKKIQKDVCYEIILLLDYEEEIEGSSGIEVQNNCKKISTKKYLFNGNIYPFNVAEFQPPMVYDIALYEVLQNGTLCSYEPEGNMYIYQYNNKLYWFLRSDCEAVEENHYVPYHIHTSMVSNLPDESEQYGFENRDFYFSNNEVQVAGELYRVAIADLPHEYAITYVSTGLYSLQNSKWIWNTRFQVNVKELENYE